MDRSAALTSGNFSRTAAHGDRWGDGRALYMLKCRRCECTWLVPPRLLDHDAPFVVSVRHTIGDTPMHFFPHQNWHWPWLASGHANADRNQDVDAAKHAFRQAEARQPKTGNNGLTPRTSDRFSYRNSLGRRLRAASRLT